MKSKPAFVCILLFVAALFVFQAPNSGAVPAFARRESAKCQMCHFRLPELSEDAHAYVRRGLREAHGGMAMGGGTKEAAMPPGMDMGSQAKAPARPRGAATPRDLGEPMTLEWQKYLTIMGHHAIEAGRGTKTEFNSGEIEAWMGGPIDDHWSGLAVLAFDIEGGGVEVEQAYGQYNTSWSPRFGSVRFGQLRPLAILFNGAGPSMPLSAPVVLTVPSSARNPYTPKMFVRGVELGAVNLPRWNAYVGAGQPEMDTSVEGSHTDLYASAELLFGEKGNAVGVFGYRGEIPPAPGQTPVRFDRVALFANLYAPRLKGVLGLLYGSDRPEAEASLISRGGFLLGEALLADRWAGYARYDYARRGIAGGDPETTAGPTLGLSFWAQTQVRLTLESRFLKDTGAPRDRTAEAEVMWVF